MFSLKEILEVEILIFFGIWNLKIWNFRNGGLAQLARAPALHAGGHRFDSDILHRAEVLRKCLVYIFSEGARSCVGDKSRTSVKFIDILR